MSYITIHETLNELYVCARTLSTYLEESNVAHQFQFISGNYLKIEDHYEVQAYPIPIVTIKDKGDIGFNLDGMFFEFFVKKQTALRLNIEKFSTDFAVDVYGADDCEVDYYKEGMDNLQFKNAIEKSKENAFGISFYMSVESLTPEEIYDKFITCYQRIIKGE